MPKSITVKELLSENKEDLKVGSAIMKEAGDIMMDPGTFSIGSEMMLGAKSVWVSKGQYLRKKGVEMGSKELIKAGNDHIKSARQMSDMAFKKARKAGAHK